MIPYVEREVASGARAASVLRHMVGLFHQVRGARAFRPDLSVAAARPGAGAEVPRNARALVPDGRRRTRLGQPRTAA